MDGLHPTPSGDQTRSSNVLATGVQMLGTCTCEYTQPSFTHFVNSTPIHHAFTTLLKIVPHLFFKKSYFIALPRHKPIHEGRIDTLPVNSLLVGPQDLSNPVRLKMSFGFDANLMAGHEPILVGAGNSWRFCTFCGCAGKLQRTGAMIWKARHTRQDYHLALQNHAVYEVEK